MSKSRFLTVTCVVAALSAPMGQAWADDLQPKQDPREMLEDSMRMILGALEMMMKSIPQYEAPVIMENGDILIRRKHPGDDEDSQPAPNSDRT